MKPSQSSSSSMEDSSLQQTQSEIENKSVEVNCGEDDAHHREPSPNSSKVSEPCCLAVMHEEASDDSADVHVRVLAI